MSGTEALQGRRILVVEDEYFLAEEITETLGRAGAEVVGPVSRVGEALALALSEGHLDAAVLDVNLANEMVWPVADVLAVRGVPMVLATGYDAGVIPSAHSHLPRCEKPVEANDIARALARAII